MSVRRLLIGSIFAAGFACTSTIQTGQLPENGNSGTQRSRNALQKNGNGLSDSDTAPETEHTHPETEHTPPAPDKTGNKPSESNPPPATGSSDPNVVEFTIPAGTGRKAWNSPSNPIRVRQGQTLVVKNGDSQMHWIHTNFSPFPHPFQGIPPGQSARYRINGSNASGMRDHLTFAPIYMTVTR